MGPFSLRSPTAVTQLPSFPMRKAPMERCTPFAARSLPFPSSKSSFSDHRDITSRPLSSGTFKVATGSNAKTAEATETETVSKDNDLVFVAGATGRVGSRTVRELLKLGFRVRAGVRSTQRAETLVQSVQQMKLDGDRDKPVERLEIVECDLENPSVIGPAIGSASTVICCIGASEKEVFDITGPYRIDFQATKNLIEAATLAKVNHFILLTSLGTNKIGFPAAILNLFWGVLTWKRKAEEALIASGLPYTIVRPGGMERPTDSYKETHNIILASEDTYFGGQVSNLQVAELMAFMAKTRNLSLYKVVEVIAETTAPLTPMEVLLSKIPPEREIPAELNPVEVPPSIGSESITPLIEEEPVQIEQVKERPLSPYFMYDDLKPPVSPTPTPSTAPAIPKEKQVEVQAISAPETTSGASSSIPTKAITEEKIEVTFEKTYVLSPYTAYEDLKPPTSPTPIPPSVEKKHVNAIQIESSLGDGSLGTAPILPDVPPQSSGSRSPYHAYEDLKPPTSPGPYVPKF